MMKIREGERGRNQMKKVYLNREHKAQENNYTHVECCSAYTYIVQSNKHILTQSHKNLCIVLCVHIYLESMNPHRKTNRSAIVENQTND